MSVFDEVLLVLLVLDLGDVWERNAHLLVLGLALGVFFMALELVRLQIRLQLV